jgi:hypothetical protein
MAMDAVARRGRGGERWPFNAMAWACVATVFAGFARSFHLRHWYPESRIHTPAET